MIGDAPASHPPKSSSAVTLGPDAPAPVPNAAPLLLLHPQSPDGLLIGGLNFGGAGGAVCDCVNTVWVCVGGGAGAEVDAHTSLDPQGSITPVPKPALVGIVDDEFDGCRGVCRGGSAGLGDERLNADVYAAALGNAGFCGLGFGGAAGAAAALGVIAGDNAGAAVGVDWN